MSWYKICLTTNEQAIGMTGTIQAEIEKIWLYSITEQKGAVFASKTVRPTVLYFNPASIESCKHIIAKHKGVPCDQPTDELTGIIGYGIRPV